MRWCELLETDLSNLLIRLEGQMICAYLGKGAIGWFTIADHKDGTYSLHANVDMFHRRMGIAKAVYDWAEENLPGKLVPYDRLSPEAMEMWKKRRPEAVKDYVRDGANFFSPAGVKKWLT